MPHVDINGRRCASIGFGTWMLKGQACADAVQDALEQGYRHIDTAQIYGNEAEVGRGIVASGIPRQQLWLTTKVWASQLSPEGIVSSTEQSLERLGVQQVDLLLVHWPVFEQASLEQVMRAMDGVRQRGWAHSIGVSNFTAAQVRQARAVAPIVNNQIEYHPYLRQDTVLNACRKEGLFVTAYSPLARGRVLQDPLLAQLAGRHRATPAQIALAWLINQPGVVAIPKASSPERRAANLDAQRIRLNAQEMTMMGALARGMRLVDPGGLAPQWDR